MQPGPAADVAAGKRLSTDEPLTEHDVADRLDKAALRLWRILLDVEQLGPETERRVRASRYLTNATSEARVALARFLDDVQPASIYDDEVQP